MQIYQLFLPEVNEAIKNGDLESLRAVFEDLHPSDVVELLRTLSSENIASIIRLLRFPKATGVFEQLDLQTQAEALHHLGRSEIVNILEELSPDDRVDLIQRLPEQTVNSLLPFIQKEDRENVRRLLQYRENTAGSVMTTEYAEVPSDITVEKAFSHLRHHSADIETIYYIYVTDQEHCLLGTASIRDLVMADPSEIITNLMTKDPISVPVDMDQEEVFRTFEKYDFLAVPVVDQDMKLVGIITHDDIIDVAVEEQTEDVHRMGAMEPIEAPYLKASFWTMAQKRGFWLLLLFVGQFFTFSALNHFKSTIEQVLVLMLFVPLIISSGGNSGSQSVTLITRAIALGDVKLRDTMRVIRRESGIGILLGIFLCLVGMLWARFIWDSSWNICLAVGISLICVVTFGALVGALLPLIFKHYGFDPAIMSSPFVASIVDVIGIVIYFTVAQTLLSL